MRPRLWAAALAASLATTVWPARAGAASGVSGLQWAYWWSAESSSTQLPPPPSVPAGGLWVASDPSGEVAVSAVRFTLPPGAVDPVLTLKVSSASPASQVAVLACPTASNWKPVKGPGPWATRPVADCSAGQVTGQLSSGGNTMTFDLTSLISGQVADVLLIPAATSDPSGGVSPVPLPGSVPPSFSATFDQPAPSEVAFTLPSTVPPPPTTSPSTAVAAVPAVQAPTTPAVPSTAAPPAPAAAASPAPSPPPTAGGLPPELALPSSAGSPPRALPSHSGSVHYAVASRILGRSWRDRTLLALVIVDLGVALAWSTGRGREGDRPLRLGEIPATVPAGRPALRRQGRPPPLR